ncbi:septum formation protein Maf [Candidatus Peregrinibacteria bacterium RIFOXYC2_FULL_33_13]|nr:MAG: septum formation protein Maf [Candidatus Peregrinibacteria bacterium GW2011_GWA2_33_10]KKP41208.1 MAG: maf protein, septum formation protein [Candidatus Peregrinibacteria bacterium GW2011_GWC2_33_13]OGJ49334.1 MAG: septum formation protein Maf [Candidatus Peregrinibacteria bacterium RIFOXYA2_FULL_33_7]OGJ54532.1 MAG: septum formation protein Maf [Candidatus Peregrinibacteria bacterium RIFOXYC2_FULL_33_13]
MLPIILASKSPRREQILNQINLDFKIQPSNFEEIISENIKPEDLVLKNAIGKAREIAAKNPNSIIIGVDTIGSYKHHILEKPKDQEDALRILKILNNTTHEVYSGLCVINTKTREEITHIEKTEVTFGEMTEEEMWKYIHTKEGMDKAAAFAVQGIGSIFIKKINGCYYNVMGLPIYSLVQIFKRLGVDVI